MKPGAQTSSDPLRLSVESSLRTVPCLCVLVLLLLGCGDSGEGPTYGEWTMMEKPVELQEDLRISETEDFYFGTVTDLDVTSEGRLVIADQQASNIKVLRSDGSLLDTLGGPGQGPGEFQRLSSVQVARGDSIYAYDNRERRLTVFTPTTLSTARTVNVPGDEQFAGRVLVLEQDLVGGFSAGLLAYQNAETTPLRTWRLLGPRGEPGDTLMQTHRRQMAMTAGEVFHFWDIPFGRETKIDVGPDDRLYYGWTDSLHVVAQAATGPTEIVASMSAPSVPVQDVERDSALNEVNTDALRRKASAAFPDTKPAFTELVVAEDGRLWVRRPQEGPDSDAALWWVLDPNEQTIGEACLPTDVEISVVQNGRVYGRTTTEMGAPAVVRYRIDGT